MDLGGNAPIGVQDGNDFGLEAGFGWLGGGAGFEEGRGGRLHLQGVGAMQ